MPSDQRRQWTGRRAAPISRRTMLRNSAAFALALPSMSSLLAACGKDGGSSDGELVIATPENPVKWPIKSDNEPIADGLAPESNATLKLYNYDAYIDPEALAAFEDEFNTTVEVSTYTTADEAVAKLRSGQVDYDIYFPSYDAIGKLVTGDLLRPLNHTYIPNISNVWPVSAGARTPPKT
jgi:spermidine/putrescine transport system substrate-binding protein